ncbi:hypothetical protein ES702_01252 [subsurface metagenome]
MKNAFVRKAISPDLVVEANKIINAVKESLGIELNGIQSTKVAAWKLKNSKININEKRLLQILGGKI